MIVWDVIGIMGGVGVTIGWIPEIYHAWKTRRLEDVNIWFLLISITGALCFTVFGIHEQVPITIIATNVVAFVFMMTVLIMKWAFEKK
jgi:MtN3 and saliva related transmembrane protein